MSELLNGLKVVRSGEISSSYMAIMVAIDMLDGKASVHDISEIVDQPLPILRTNLSRMCKADWCKKVGINQYVTTPKWVGVSRKVAFGSNL